MKKVKKNSIVLFIIIIIIAIIIIGICIIKKESTKKIEDESNYIFNQYINNYIQSNHNSYSSYIFKDRFTYEENSSGIFESYKKIKGSYVYRYQVFGNDESVYDIYYRQKSNQILDNYFAKQIIEKIKSANEKEKYKYLEVETPIATEDRKISQIVHTINIYLDNTKNDLTDLDCYNQLINLKNTLINDNIGNFLVYIIIDNNTFFLLQCEDWNTYTVCRFYNRVYSWSPNIETYEDFLEAFHPTSYEEYSKKHYSWKNQE